MTTESHSFQPAPPADLTLEAPMPAGIERQSLLRFSFFYLITSGFYNLAWLIKNLRQLNLVTGANHISFNIVVFVGAMHMWSIALGQLSIKSEFEVNEIIWAYLALNLAHRVYFYLNISKPFLTGLDAALIQNYKNDLRPNRLWAIVFAQFYILHAINKSDEVVRRAKLMHAAPNSQT